MRVSDSDEAAAATENPTHLVVAFSQDKSLHLFHLTEGGALSRSSTDSRLPSKLFFVLLSHQKNNDAQHLQDNTTPITSGFVNPKNQWMMHNWTN